MSAPWAGGTLHIPGTRWLTTVDTTPPEEGITIEIKVGSTLKSVTVLGRKQGSLLKAVTILGTWDKESLSITPLR